MGEDENKNCIKSELDIIVNPSFFIIVLAWKVMKIAQLMLMVIGISAIMPIFAPLDIRQRRNMKFRARGH